MRIVESTIDVIYILVILYSLSRHKQISSSMQFLFVTTKESYSINVS